MGVRTMCYSTDLQICQVSFYYTVDFLNQSCDVLFGSQSNIDDSVFRKRFSWKN